MQVTIHNRITQEYYTTNNPKEVVNELLLRGISLVTTIGIISTLIINIIN